MKNGNNHSNGLTGGELLNNSNGNNGDARGRPTKYNPLWHPQLTYWIAKDGATDKEIAKALDIGYKTLNVWKKKHPEFDLAIKRGKTAPDDLVEQCLFQRATGYSYPEDKIMQHEGIPVIVPTIKHLAPDVTAQIFWLKNRRPDKWRDKKQLDFTGLDEALEAFRQIK
jgi:hypothetical protein